MTAPLHPPLDLALTEGRAATRRTGSTARRARRARRSLERRAAAVLTAGALAALALAVPSATASAPASSVEGEAFSLAAGSGAAYSDPHASGGRALEVWRSATATASVGAPEGATRLEVVVSGDQCQGAPAVRLSVDGRVVGSGEVTATSWTTVAVPGRWTTGAHTVAIAYTNDLMTASCDRDLRLDRVAFTRGGPVPTTPTPTPTASASPTASPGPTPSATPRPTPSATPSATPSTTPSATPSATTSARPTATASVTPSATATAPPAAAGNPLAGARFYVEPDSDARREVARRSGDPAAVAALRKIADQSVARWYGDWVPTSRVREEVAARSTAAAGAGAVPTFVVYAIPGRDCGQYSAGGLSGPAAYGQWIRAFAAGLGDRRSVVVVEPDALAQLDCLSPSARGERTAMLRDALSVLRSATGAVVYLDAGNASWVPADQMAARLREAGVGTARGFSLNVSNFGRTAAQEAYGEDLAARLGGAHFVVDTSRNGLGPATGAEAWCNPQGRALGERPTTATTSPSADAYLWIKTVGESDGDCGRGEPAAGTWWPDYAIGLGARAAY